MKPVFLFLALMGVFTPCFPSVPNVNDIKSQSLGGLRALSERSLNPTIWSFQEKKRLGMSVQNHFQIKELNSFSGYAIFPNSWLDAGGCVSEFGYEDYHQWEVSAGFSKKLHSQIALGTNLRYRQVTGIYGEGIRPYLGLDLALSYKMNDHLHWGLLFEGVAHNSPGADRMLSLGIDYSLLASCHLFMEYGSNFEDVSRLSIGIDYELMEHFFVRAGCYTQDFAPTFGVSFALSQFVIDVACDRHAYLGYSTGLGISYQF